MIIVFSHESQASVDLNIMWQGDQCSMFSPLHVAALSSCWSELECLVGWGAALDPADLLGNTPVYVVITQTRKAATKLTSPTLKKVNIQAILQSCFYVSVIRTCMVRINWKERHLHNCHSLALALALGGAVLSDWLMIVYDLLPFQSKSLGRGKQRAGQGRAGPSLGLTLPMCLIYSVDRERNSTKQGKLDTCHRTRDYFVVQWPLIDFCAYETGVDHAKINSELTA